MQKYVQVPILPILWLLCLLVSRVQHRKMDAVVYCMNLA